MKIVHLIGYFTPELGYQEYYLARQHKRMGHDVYVITSDLLYPLPNIENMLREAGIKNTSRKRKVGFSIIDDIKVYRLPHVFEYNDFILVRNVKKTLESIEPDVVIAHESRQGTPALGALYKKKLGYKLIVDQHDFFRYSPHLPVIKKILISFEYYLFRKHLIDFSLKQADRIVAVTEETKKYLEQAHKIKENVVKLIPLGVDTESFGYNEVDRDKIRNKYNIKGEDIVILFAGTITRRKGLEILLEVFAELDTGKLKLMIVGGGDEEYMDSLKQLSKKLRIERNILFTGFVNKKHLAEYFSAADIGVWPSNNSVIIMEAMVCKLPIIMVDLQLSHLVKYSNGFKFKMNDKNSLKGYIEELVNNSSLRKQMGENSYIGVRKDYSYEEIAKRFLELV